MIGFNALSNEGALQIAKIKWPELKELNLGYNAIMASGVEAILRGVWKNL